MVMNIVHEKEQSKYHSIEDPVPSNLLDLRSFCSADQIRLEASIIDLDFTEAPTPTGGAFPDMDIKRERVDERLSMMVAPGEHCGQLG
jgi:hypothetical protein